MKKLFLFLLFFVTTAYGVKEKKLARYISAAEVEALNPLAKKLHSLLVKRSVACSAQPMKAKRVKKKKNYACGDCNKVYEWKMSLSKHRNDKHPIVRCKCGATLATLKGFGIHCKKMHGGTPPYILSYTKKLTILDIVQDAE